MSKLSFLDGEPSESEPLSAAETQAPPDKDDPPAQPPPQQPAPQPEQAPPAQPRAADGKFAPKSDAASAEPEPQPAPVAAAPVSPPPAPEPGHVPIGAMLDEREKRQALEKRVAEFEAADAKAKATAEAAKTKAPEFTEDPLGHLDARDADTFMRVYEVNRTLSRKWAVKEYGKETIEKVDEWAKAKAAADPQFNASALSSDDPYEFAYQAWKEAEILTEVRQSGLTSAELAEFKAWKTAQAGQLAQPLIAAAPAAPPQTPPRPPPQSLASAPSAGGPAHVPTGPGKAFAGVFGEA